MAGGHVHLGYHRPTDTNEMEVVFLPDTTTVAEAVHLILQVIQNYNKLVGRSPTSLISLCVHGHEIEFFVQSF